MSTSATEQPLIIAHNLTKRYGLGLALHGVTLGVPRGALVALMGPNGSGKSTLLRLLCGLAKPSAGSLTVGGWALPREAAAVRAQLGVVSHRPLLYETLTGRENLRVFARLYRLSDAEDRIAARLREVGLARRADVPARTYSRGMLQRLSIARAWLHDPAVLLLDEPYTGLDVDGAALLDAMLRTAHADRRTVLMATHEPERAAVLATRLVVLARGRLVHDAPWGGTGPQSGAALGALYAAAIA